MIAVVRAYRALALSPVRPSCAHLELVSPLPEKAVARPARRAAPRLRSSGTSVVPPFSPVRDLSNTRAVCAHELTCREAPEPEGFGARRCVLLCVV